MTCAQIGNKRWNQDDQHRGQCSGCGIVPTHIGERHRTELPCIAGATRDDGKRAWRSAGEPANREMRRFMADRASQLEQKKEGVTRGEETNQSSQQNGWNQVNRSITQSAIYQRR